MYNIAQYLRNINLPFSGQVESSVSIYTLLFSTMQGLFNGLRNQELATLKHLSHIGLSSQTAYARGIHSYNTI